MGLGWIAEQRSINKVAKRKRPKVVGTAARAKTNMPLPVNHLVAGSSPAKGAKHNKGLQILTSVSPFCLSSG